MTRGLDAEMTMVLTIKDRQFRVAVYAEPGQWFATIAEHLRERQGGTTALVRTGTPDLGYAVSRAGPEAALQGAIDYIFRVTGVRPATEHHTAEPVTPEPPRRSAAPPSSPWRRLDGGR